MTLEEQLLERIAAAVEETNKLIRDNMAAEQELARRRACNRDNMRRARGSVVCTHNDVYTHEVGERNEEEKRDIPPTPPIERKEEGKKDSLTPARARKSKMRL